MRQMLPSLVEGRYGLHVEPNDGEEERLARSDIDEVPETVPMAGKPRARLATWIWCP